MDESDINKIENFYEIFKRLCEINVLSYSEKRRLYNFNFPN